MIGVGIKTKEFVLQTVFLELFSFIFFQIYFPSLIFFRPQSFCLFFQNVVLLFFLPFFFRLSSSSSSLSFNINFDFSFFQTCFHFTVSLSFFVLQFIVPSFRIHGCSSYFILPFFSSYSLFSSSSAHFFSLPHNTFFVFIFFLTQT